MVRNILKQRFHVRLIIDLSSLAGREILQGVSEYVKQFDNWRFETTISFYGEKRTREISINKHTTDGIICFVPNKNTLDKVIRSGIPAVVFGADQPIQGYINFCVDDMMLCKKAFDHFRHLGIKKFAYCGFGHLDWSTKRGEIFREIVETNGFEVDVYPRRLTQRPKKWEKEKPFLTKWLESLPNPIGLFTANDFRGKQVLEACWDAQVEVPDEIAVLGPDNDECICPFTNPPLSSIARYTRKAGYEAATKLTRLMSGDMPENSEIIVGPEKVIQRQSTDILQVDDPEVRLAVRYIREHCNQILRIPDVLEHVAVSRRTLELKFAQTLDHTIRDEIRKCHLQYISKLLIETNMPVLELARSIGYTSEHNISRLFRKAMGCTPREYRKKFGPK